MGEIHDNGLAERMEWVGSTTLIGRTALEVAFDSLGVAEQPTTVAMQAVRERADELSEGVRRDLTDQGFLNKSAA
jgi:hypothetical protein